MPLPPRRAARLAPLLLLFPTALADGIWSGGPCLSACQLCLSLVNFGSTPLSTPFLEKQCEGGLRAASLYLCSEVHCPGEDTVEGLRTLNESCGGINSTLPPLDILGRWTEEEREGVRRIESVSEDGDDVYDEAVIPSEELLRLAVDTMDAVMYVTKYHNFYGKMVSWFWAAVVIVGTLRHIAHVFRSARPRDDPRPETNQDSDRETLLLKGRPKGTERASLYLRRFVTVPATFGRRCLQNVGWCTIPPRIESLTILLFLILNIAFSVHGYYVFKGNLYFSPTSKQIYRYVSDRTGILSWASFPAIWLFGMRNNLLMGLTGWGFGTFNNFHRWIARIATLQAVIHSIGYTVIVSRKGGWPYFLAYWQQLFWWTGEVATIAMCALVVASLFWLRRNLYETFLVLHVVLSLIVLVTMLFHVSIFLGQYDTPFWVCVLIWLADRLLRSVRVLAFNPWFWNTRARLSYSPASNTVRLVIPSSNSAYEARPGTYYYVYVLGDSRPWESHPFTMAYASSGREPTSGETSPLLPSAKPPGSASGAKSPKITFLIRPYDGFTRRLRDMATKDVSPRVLVEGPYGTTHPLHTFDDVLFIVGGSGIVVPLAHLSEITSSAHVRSMRIAWSAREAAFVSEVLQRDMAGHLSNDKITMDVFLTSGAEVSTDVGLEDWPKKVSAVLGRPDVSAEIRCAAQGAEGGSLAVVACGPAVMADEARRAVVGVLGEGYHRVEYFQEAFNW